MGDDIVSCLCSSLAGLVGAVHDAVAQAENLSAPNDVIASSPPDGGAGADGMASDCPALTATHIAALLLLLAVVLSAFRKQTPALPEKTARHGTDGAGSDDRADPVA